MFDVIILGSGMSGGILGSILARHNVRVLIVDAAKHPRFAIGESTIPETTKLLKILGDRFDVPELANISSFIGVRSKISPNCGLKRNFGFVYHRQGEPQNPDEIYQAVLPDAFEGPEIHYFRQDVDAYLIEVAKQYGATVRENTRIADVNISEQGVCLETTEGEKFEGQYVVDGSGYRSVLANKFRLRENPSRFKTHSRSLFTHMIDVKPYEDCVPPGFHKVPRKWSQGTLHHCFDGGWMWVIPFNNGSECPNSLVSVGLQLDTRKFPNKDWYKSKAYRSRAVREPRAVLAEFGTHVPDNVEVRVHDSTADMRYLVLPLRPPGTEGMDEEAIAALVTRDSMIGVALASMPETAGASRS
jgi:FADH2 O2-dependent halogenase